MTLTDRLDALCTELRESRTSQDHRWRTSLQGVLTDLHALISEILDEQSATADH